MVEVTNGAFRVVARLSPKQTHMRFEVYCLGLNGPDILMTAASVELGRNFAARLETWIGSCGFRASGLESATMDMGRNILK